MLSETIKTTVASRQKQRVNKHPHRQPWASVLDLMLETGDVATAKADQWPSYHVIRDSAALTGCLCAMWE